MFSYVCMCVVFVSSTAAYIDAVEFKVEAKNATPSGE